MQLANKVDVAYAPEFPWIYFGHTILTFQFLLSTGADLNLQRKRFVFQLTFICHWTFSFKYCKTIYKEAVDHKKVGYIASSIRISPRAIFGKLLSKLQTRGVRDSECAKSRLPAYFNK